MNLNNFAKVEDHVKQVIEKAKIQNQKTLQEYIAALNLDKKPIEEQVLCLYREILKVEKTADSFACPEFILLANYPDTLVKVIYHRILFFGKSECDQLAEANLINAKRTKLQQLLAEKKEELPPFTMQDFLNGENDIVFYNLKQRPMHTPTDEYFQMRVQQNGKLLEGVLLQVNHFANSFRQCLNGEASELKNINGERDQLKNILTEGKNWKQAELNVELFKLNALSNSWNPENKGDFHKKMQYVLSLGVDHGAFTLVNLKRTISDFQKATKNYSLTDPSLLCISLLVYDDWLKAVAAEKIDIRSAISLNYVQLFKSAVSEGEAEADTYIEQFKSRKTALNTAEEFKDVILHELHGLRKALAEDNSFGYFQCLDDTSKLKAHFYSNCLFENNSEIQSKALKQAVLVADKTDFLIEELVEKYYDEVLHKSIKSIPLVELQIVDLINSMVPDSGTIQKILNACAKAIGELRAGAKPGLFVLWDLQEVLLELFDSSENRLLDYFQKYNRSVLNEYTYQSILELKMRHHHAKKNGQDLVAQFDALSDLLKDEMEQVSQYANPIDLAIFLDPVPSEEYTTEEPTPPVYSMPVFTPKQSDFRGHGKGPVSFSDIRDEQLFAKFEIELFDSGILDVDYNFQKKKGNKEMLAALYHILIQKNYFRKKNFKNGRNYDSWHYRQYLDCRYNVDTSQQFRKCTLKDIEGIKYRYTWVDNIAYCR